MWLKPFDGLTYKSKMYVISDKVIGDGRNENNANEKKERSGDSEKD